MPFFESEEDKKLRAEIAAEEKEKFDKEQLKLKKAKMRKEEKAKLQSGGIVGFVKKQIKEVI